METIEQTAVIKYLQKKGMSPQIHEEMTATLGESAVSYGIVKRWFRTFKCGSTSCEDWHGAGPPRTVTTPENIYKVHDIELQDRRITIRDIVEKTGFSYHSVHNILEKEFKKLTARWVPRMLTLAQKRQRTVLCEQHLTNFRADKKIFIERYVTMDETWVHHYDPETKIQSMQWKLKGSLTRRNPRCFHQQARCCSLSFGMPKVWTICREEP